MHGNLSYALAAQAYAVNKPRPQPKWVWELSLTYSNIRLSVWLHMLPQCLLGYRQNPTKGSLYVTNLWYTLNSKI